MNRRIALVLGPLSLLVAGCGAPSAVGSGVDTHVMSDGSTMSGSSMHGMGSSAGMDSSHGTAMPHHGGRRGPSKSASMICGPEVRGAVADTLELDRTPRALHSFAHRVFRCVYLVGAGEIRLSVDDADAAGAGRASFDTLRSRLPGSRALTGVEALGFPSFETVRGDVVFLKDDKTLWVDASRVPTTALPSGMTSTEVAYGIAAAIIACWNE